MDNNLLMILYMDAGDMLERKPMPRTTLFVDPTREGLAAPYYKLFPTEPTASDHSADWLQVGASHITLRDQNLERLLEAILRHATTGGNVLFVGHGFSQGLGLFIGDRSHDVFADLIAFEAIRGSQEGRLADADVARTLQLSLDAYTALKSQIDRVRRLSLNRIDARACDFGSQDTFMYDVQVVLGCNIFCAPTEADIFGPIPIHQTKNKAEFEKWREALQKESQTIVIEGESPDRIALAFKDFTILSIHAKGAAESKKALTNWAVKHLPSDGSIYSGAQIPLYVHGISDINAKKIFFAGEGQFRKLLYEATRGNEPVANGRYQPGSTAQSMRSSTPECAATSVVTQISEPIRNKQTPSPADSFAAGPSRGAQRRRWEQQTTRSHARPIAREHGEHRTFSAVSTVAHSITRRSCARSVLAPLTCTSRNTFLHPALVNCRVWASTLSLLPPGDTLA